MKTLVLTMSEEAHDRLVNLLDDGWFIHDLLLSHKRFPIFDNGQRACVTVEEASNYVFMEDLGVKNEII